MRHIEAGLDAASARLAPGDGLADGGGGKVHVDRGLAAIAVMNMPEVTVEVWNTVVMTYAPIFFCVPLSGSEPHATHSALVSGRKMPPARARRNGWRREERLGKHQGVRQTERGLAERGHDDVRDAVAEAGLDEPARQEERERDEPVRDLRRERAERGAEGEQAGHHGHAQADQSRRAQGERLKRFGEFEEGKWYRSASGGWAATFTVFAPSRETNWVGLSTTRFPTRGRAVSREAVRRTLVMMPMMVPTKTARRCQAWAVTPAGAGMHQMIRPASTEYPRGMLSLAPFHSARRGSLHDRRRDGRARRDLALADGAARHGEVTAR